MVYWKTGDLAKYKSGKYFFLGQENSDRETLKDCVSTVAFETTV